MATVLTGKPAFIVAALLIGAAVLSGCGRAGAPLKPSQAELERSKAENGSKSQAPIPNRENTEKRFILDGLLE